MKRQKIFITGGAGYIGTTLIPLLLEQGHEVTVYDILMFNNGDKLLPHMSNSNFNFVKGDIRNEGLLAKHIKGHDVVIHLAALVGFPLCRQAGEEETHSVNTEGTDIVIRSMTPDQFLLFGSTGSNYGEVTGVCTEETPLNPLSIYGRTKTIAETNVMARDNSTAFRFATAFGLAPRLRLDLLVNDLTYKSYKESYAVIYESHFLRTFIHVKDIARAFMFAIDNHDQMKDNVYNVGSDKMNYSKKEVCELIKTELPETYFNYAEVGEDADKRNYMVSYDKINSLGFDTTTSVTEGIKEIVKSIPLISITSNYHNVNP
jgi:nucleoside-diphosphate-sugar epimerase